MNFEITQCATYSGAKINALRTALLGKFGDKSDFTIGVNGSFARKEASIQSDLDYFILCRKEDQRKSALLQSESVHKIVREIVEKPPSADGAFGNAESLEELIHNIGGKLDDNDKFTRRILLLLEGDWLYGHSLFNDARDDLIQRYIPDSRDPKKLPLFLLNDIIRYYRTVCVDFEFKTVEGAKPWGTRNIKLVFSRKLMYFSGVLIVAECDKGTTQEKRDLASHYFNMPAVERIEKICGSSAARPLELYNHFLSEFSQENVRAACDSVTMRDRENALFRGLKDKGHEFSNSLITTLKERYACDHPIHRALLL